jgi:hypothetical protein
VAQSPFSKPHEHKFQQEKQMKIEFPIVTACPDCQAIADGQRMFEVVEGVAKREGLDPYRVARSLRECLAIWHSMTLGAFGPEQGTIAEEHETFISETERSLRHQMQNDGESLAAPGHLH